MQAFLISFKIQKIVYETFSVHMPVSGCRTRIRKICTGGSKVRAGRLHFRLFMGFPLQIWLYISSVSNFLETTQAALHVRGSS